eukprot:TRINITY_DN9050_c0_g1_i5.p1 TRINITY_DN9050_c0_g1~~TRINITY_DN9050_c0_g1_i5.p1  ORF type:complete len:714 (+),score=110.99 TRINITY_DN9050_c0_g1_i5:60-2144(+)
MATPSMAQKMPALYEASSRKACLGGKLDTDGDTVHDLFVKVVEACPHRQALLTENGLSSTTYLSLASLVTRLAGELQELLEEAPSDPKAKAQALVGISVADPQDTIVSMLAVASVGHSFVAVEQSLPQERQKAMLSGCRAVVLPASGDCTSLPIPEGVPCLNAPREDDMADSPKGFSMRAALTPVANISSEAVFCVVFTSGSTGRPKAVALTHRQVLVRLRWAWQSYPWAADEVACFKTSTAFVDFIAEVFGALLQGVPLATLPPAHRADPSRVLSTVRRHAVTRLTLVPAMVRTILVQSDVKTLASSLRVVHSSGAPLTWELTRAVRAALPQCTILDLYGLSETMADSTCLRISPDDAVPENDDGSAPIGREIPGCAVQLRGDDGYGDVIDEATLGVEGIITVSGPMVGPGYLSDPEGGDLAKFNPFPTLDGRPTVVTGDVGSWLPGGVLQFHGRRDQLIKVHGQKISLLEVEDAVQALPCVLQAAVSSWVPTGPVAEARIVAHLVLKAGSALDDAAVAAVLKKSLPVVAMPTLVPLDQMPLTASGKLDRRTLAMRAESDEKRVLRSQQQDSVRATDLMLVVAEVWGEVLFGDPSLFVDSASCTCSDPHFLELGGNSITSVMVAEKLHERLRVRLPLASVVNAGRLSDFAGLLATLQQNGVAESNNSCMPDAETSPFIVQQLQPDLRQSGQGN